MLIDFSVKNYGPFRDKVTLSAMKTEYREHPENVITTSSNKLLSSLIIFGPNAQGKSFMLKGLAALRRLLWSPTVPDETIREYDPFRFSESTVKEPTEFEICLDIDGSAFIYSVAFDSRHITHESLRRLRRNESFLFERKEDVFVINGGFDDPKKPRARNLSGEKTGKDIINVKEKTTPNTPYLTVAASFNDKICSSIYREIRRMTVIDPRYSGSILGIDELLKDDTYKTMFFNALRAADFDITDIREEVIPKNTIDNGQDLVLMLSSRSISIEHNRQDIPADLRWLPLENESEGTKNMIRIIGPIIKALKDGGTIVIDEFGSRLHPMLTKHILELFKSDANVGGAQLIVNSHNLDLMDIESIFRRDQIYFVNKDRRTGASDLYSLSDFKGVRKDTDVKKAYLQGRFDAIPNIVSDRRWHE